MVGVISFEQHAVARLRQRLGAAEEAKQDLLAFARGHSGAVASIHAAVLAALHADDLEAVIAIVTKQWPAILGVDSTALALFVGEHAFRADACGVERLAPQILDRTLARLGEVEMRNVERGHPLFGSASASVRCEGLVRIEPEHPLPNGLLLLGQRSEQSLDGQHGAELLLFLGQVLGAIIRRWLIEPETNPS